MELDGLDQNRLPRHVAIIMDGNGRWAQRRGKSRIEGHRRNEPEDWHSVSYTVCLFDGELVSAAR